MSACELKRDISIISGGDTAEIGSDFEIACLILIRRRRLQSKWWPKATVGISQGSLSSIKFVSRRNTDLC